MKRTVKKAPGIAGVSVVLEESADFDKLFKVLPDEAMRKSRLIVKKAADIGNRDYKERLPRGPTGNLKASVMVGGKVKVNKVKGNYVAYVGATRPKGPHAHLIEEGHRVVPRGKKGQSNKGSNAKALTGKARVEGKQDLVKTFNATRVKTNNFIIAEVQKLIKENGG